MINLDGAELLINIAALAVCDINVLTSFKSAGVFSGVCNRLCLICMHSHCQSAIRDSVFYINGKNNFF